MLRKLGIEPGEGRVFAWGAMALFLLGWADVSVKNVSEAFFIKRVGVELLPYAFLVSALLLVVTTWAFGNFAVRRDRLRLLPRTFFGLGLLLLPLWLLVRTGFEPALGLLLVASKQITSIALLVFWIAMGDLLHGRQTKRLFAPMMAGVTVGTILGSFASEPVGRALGIDSLLPVSAFVMVLGALATLPLRRFRPRFERTTAVPGSPAAARAARAAADASKSEDGGGAGQLRRLWQRSVLFRLLFVTALCSGILGPMLYWQFQYVADLNTTGEDALLAFYARFKGWVYGGVLVTQLLISGRLYQRIGVPLSAAFSPVIYLVGFMGLSLRLSMPVGVGAKAGTQLQDNAIYDPALRVL
jgi:AAA family ATP:ADP antiporter